MQRPSVGDIFLNKYEIVNLVGEGAFGSVYRAKDTKLDRFVAIKIIHSTQGVMERFAGEIEAIKKLDHPNIVKLYDFDLLPGGIPCMIMEYVNGQELGNILAQGGPFTFERIGEIALQVLDALVETHKLAIIHCDLKPENIMLTSVGVRTDVVKLIDFGVASILSSDTSSVGRSLVGTPQYMAPEQIHRKNIGPWTDIYALGLILIELSTGSFVFDDDDPREVLRKQLHEPVIFPEDLARTELGLVISKAVEKDYQLRYQSTENFYEELKSALQTMRNETQWRKSRARIPSLAAREHAFSDIFDIKQTDAYLSSEMPTVMPPSLAEVQAQELEDRNKIEESKAVAGLAKISMSLENERYPGVEAAKAKVSDGMETPYKQAPQRETKRDKKGINNAVIFIFVILIVFVFAGIYGVESGLIPWFGSKEEAADLEQDGGKAVVKQQPRRASVHALGAKMSYVSYISGFRSASPMKTVQQYRVIATPLNSKLYVNDAMVCYQTPCIIYAYGDLSRLNLRLNSPDAEQVFKLSRHKNPNEPILISLERR